MSPERGTAPLGASVGCWMVLAAAIGSAIVSSWRLGGVDPAGLGRAVFAYVALVVFHFVNLLGRGRMPDGRAFLFLPPHGPTTRDPGRGK